jgi:hypothetical protein
MQGMNSPQRVSCVVFRLARPWWFLALIPQNRAVLGRLTNRVSLGFSGLEIQFRRWVAGFLSEPDSGGGRSRR